MDIHGLSSQNTVVDKHPICTVTFWDKYFGSQIMTNYRDGFGLIIFLVFVRLFRHDSMIFLNQKPTANQTNQWPQGCVALCGLCIRSSYALECLERHFQCSALDLDGQELPPNLAKEFSIWSYAVLYVMYCHYAVFYC